MAEVVGLFISEAHGRPMRALHDVEAVANKGFARCIHGRPDSSRQVLLMDAETLALLRVAHGEVRENVTTLGLALDELRPGQELQVGQAVLAVTKPCTPCARMDGIRPGLQEELRGRRGVLCKVVQGGRIRRGDSIQIQAPASAVAREREVSKSG